MSNPVKGIILSERKLAATGATSTEIKDLSEGWYNFSMLNTAGYFKQTTQDNFNYLVEGTPVPRDDCRSFFVSDDHRGFHYFIPAGGVGSIEKVEPRDPFFKDETFRPV